ncbi:MAG: hypothetical protein JWN32_2722 [Solirubrobacterales bacterium]|nr:hypothetical protein [Solirubrobacterales bacterium]
MSLSLHQGAVVRAQRLRFRRAAQASARRRGMLILLALVLLAAASPAAANAAAGFRDFSWQAMSVNGPTGEKPQSKLWYNDGTWWGDMFDVVSSQWMIFRLDPATQTWVNTGTPLDVRRSSWADTLWDGTHLYLASAGVNPASASDSAKLYRYSYSATTKTYAVDSGFPVTIVSGGMEAIVLDKDATGALWATWTRGNQVYVNATSGADTAWGTPFVVPGAGTTVTPDDISSVVSLKGSIGVMWSNQVDGTMYFAEHHNGDPLATWAAPTKVVQGAKMADDHINLKSMQEVNGQVFATVKTSLSDVPGNSGAPLILLLKRDATTGAWSSTTISTVGDDQTRPIVMLNPSQDKLYVFATTAVGGGTIDSGTAQTAIFYKTTSMSNPSFGPGPGTPFIQTAGDQYINNATSTKQPVTAGSGVVVLASDNVSGFYMHNSLTSPADPPVTPPPCACPAGSPPAGSPPAASPGSGPVIGPGTVTANVCPTKRSAVVRWILPKHQRMASIVVNVAGKRYAKLKGTRHSVVVHLGNLAGPFSIEIRGVAKSGKVYAAARTMSGCGVSNPRAMRLVRVVHKR